jgi:hypothetical protein
MAVVVARSLALFAYPLRPRDSVPSAPLTLERHRDLGLAMLALTLVHRVVLLVVDHTVIEYLKRTLRYYQAARRLALVLFITLAAT